jgi:5-methylcytosine-specific restriction endonuclease McrA
MPNKHGSKWIRPAKRRRIYERDAWTCCYCEKDLHEGVADVRQRTLDHIVPRCQGGSNSEQNLVTCCITCNSARADRALTSELLEKAMQWAGVPLPERMAA